MGPVSEADVSGSERSDRYPYIVLNFPAANWDVGNAVGKRFGADVMIDAPMSTVLYQDIGVVVACVPC